MSRITALPFAALFVASISLSPAAESHFLGGTLDTPYFVNNSVGTDLLWGLGYYGQGIIIANVEAGHFWGGHEVFDRAAINAAVGTSLPPAPAVQVNLAPNAESPALGEIDFHATTVAHVLGGATVLPNDGGFSLSTLGSGMAPFATLWSGAIATEFDSNPNNIGGFAISDESFRLPYVEFFTVATLGRADVINSSWGGDFSPRDTEVRTITGLAAQNPMVAAVFSAGNSGLTTSRVSGPAISPNVFAVGSLGGPDQLSPSTFSSGALAEFYHPGTDTLIPAARAAVHVSAPGENFALAAYLQATGGLAPVLTPETITTDNDLYFIFSASGTSYSAPIVAGGIGLLKNLIKENPAFFPQEQALDTRVMRSVIMASSVRTESWDNAQNLDPDGALITTQALDARAGAGRFDVGLAAELYIFGTRDVPGLGGGTQLAPNGWDFAALDLGEVNDYGINLGAFAGTTSPLDFAVSLNWFVTDTFDSVTGVTNYGSFANLNLEVWSVGVNGDYDSLLAASRTAYNNTEFLRIQLAPSDSIGLRVLFNDMVYDFESPYGGDVFYGLAWSTTAIVIPEPAGWTVLAGLGSLFIAVCLRRRRPDAV
jgi:hypothetical protein